MVVALPPGCEAVPQCSDQYSISHNTGRQVVLCTAVQFCCMIHCSFDVTTSYLTVDRQENVTSHAYCTVPEMTSGVVSTWRQHIQLLWQCNMAAFTIFLFTVFIMVCVRRSHVPWYSCRLNMWHFFQ